MALNPTPLAADSQGSKGSKDKRILSGARIGVRGYAEAGVALMLDNPDAGDDDSDDEAADALAAVEADAALASAFARARAAKGMPEGAAAGQEPEPEPEPEPEGPINMDDLPDFGELQEQLVKNRTEREIAHLNRQAELRRQHAERRAAEQAQVQAELDRIAALKRLEYEEQQAIKDRHLADSSMRLQALQFQFAWSTSTC